MGRSPSHIFMMVYHLLTLPALYIKAKGGYGVIHHLFTDHFPPTIEQLFVWKKNGLFFALNDVIKPRLPQSTVGNEPILTGIDTGFFKGFFKVHAYLE